MPVGPDVISHNHAHHFVLGHPCFYGVKMLNGVARWGGWAMRFFAPRAQQNSLGPSEDPARLDRPSYDQFLRKHWADIR